MEVAWQPGSAGWTRPKEVFTGGSHWERNPKGGYPMRSTTLFLVTLVTLAGWTAGASAAETEGRTPQGDEGIAARYPGDAGIEKDPAVILVEDFEDEPKVVGWMQDGGWFGGARFGPEAGQELSGKKPAAGRRCLQYNLKTGKKSAAAGMFHRIKPQDTVYIRTYRRFEENWEWPKGYGPHDVGLHGYLGEFPSPTDSDLHVLLDFWMTGDTILRVGTPKQTIRNWTQFMKDNYGPVPVGGNGFPWNVSRPDKIVPGKWHCAEFMVKLSTPGGRDGEARLWVNGKLCSEFTDVPLRDADHADMQLSLILFSHYFHPGSPKDQTHWVDQFVVATEYIGPIAK